MRFVRVVLGLTVVLAGCSSSSPSPAPTAADAGVDEEATNAPESTGAAPAWLSGTKRLVAGPDDTSLDCRTLICRHNENTDLVTCPSEISGQRLDGPLAFFSGARLFVVARKHLQGTGKKRTSLFELTGDFAGGPLAIVDRGDPPSAGDTSYAGVALRSDGKALVTWYSGRLQKDSIWLLGMIDVTNIWQGVIDLSKIPAGG